MRGGARRARRERSIAAVRQENPVYADVLGGPEGIGIRLGIEQAIRAFLDAVERGQRPSAETDELWRRLGEAEFQAGRSLEALRAAFRTGTRAAWRGAAELATRAGVDGADRDRARRGDLRLRRRARHRRRRGLSPDPVRRGRRARAPAPPAGGAAARPRRLTIPRRSRMRRSSRAGRSRDRSRCWRSIGDSPEEVARRLDLDVLAGADAGGAWLVLPDPDGPGRARRGRPRRRRDAGGARPDGRPPPRPPARCAGRGSRSSSYRPARSRHRASTRVADHLATVILLQRARPRQGARRSSAWPRSTTCRPPSASGCSRRSPRGSRTSATRRGSPTELHVHPQTVRYRIAKLRELLGESLETADGRFELELALRARRALRAG